MQKLLVILDFPHHRRHSLRFPVPLLLPVRKQILLRRPCRSLESRSTWEWKLETYLEAAAVPCSQILPAVFSPHGAQTVGCASTSELGTGSSFLRALLPKHLLTVRCPGQCFLSSLVFTSIFIFHCFLLITAVHVP
uniref:Cytochrome b5 type B n=1 Tax=Myotis myotis TaxID=51298 RepID=A0A7J7SAS7_MYOMY|nr:cytochrome b5 type B [Myotis myotis]